MPRSRKVDQTHDINPPLATQPSTAASQRPSRLDLGHMPSKLGSSKRASANKSGAAISAEPLTQAAPDGQDTAAPIRRKQRTGHKSVPALNPAASDVRTKPKMSLLDAAALVLSQLPTKERAQGISAIELLDRVIAEGLWQRGSGRTPHMTLYSGMNRERMYGGENSRFERIGPNLFTAGKSLKGGKRTAKSGDDHDAPPAKSSGARDKKPSSRKQEA